MIRIAVRGVGKALPERVVANAEIEARLGVQPGWIESRTGIRERRFASPQDSASTLAVAAASRALSHAGIDASNIDALIVGTSTPDYQFPPTAAIVQREIGAPSSCAAFDVGAACAGFLYAFTTAASLIGSGAANRAVVVGVDLLSRHIDLDDQQTAPLFGDAAAAVVIENEETADPLLVSMGSDGSGEEAVLIPGGGSRRPFSSEILERKLNLIHMSGRDVFRSAVRIMSRLGVELGASSCDVVIAHQANKRILAEVAEQLSLEPDRFFVNIERYGNTSAASIPLALAEAWEEGRLHPGDRVLLVGLGAGYTWAGTVFTWSVAPPVVGARLSAVAGAVK